MQRYTTSYVFMQAKESSPNFIAKKIERTKTIKICTYNSKPFLADVLIGQNCFYQLYKKVKICQLFTHWYALLCWWYNLGMTSLLKWVTTLAGAHNVALLLRPWSSLTSVAFISMFIWDKCHIKRLWSLSTYNWPIEIHFQLVAS